MTEWIGRTFTSGTGWHHLERLVDVGDRMAGSTGEREAAELTRNALGEHARDAHLEEFDLQGWERGTSSVEAGGVSHECIALPRSPSRRVTGEFVDLGRGLPGDFGDHLDGAVVMVSSDAPAWFGRAVHRREKYARAVEAGAAAFVFKNHYPGCLAVTGSVAMPGAPIGEIPAVGVSAEVGARLARRYGGNPVTVAVDAEAGEATSQNVHAEVGPETDEELLVTAHVDAHDTGDGALDNGAGTATVVELSRVLADRADELDVRVHFVVFGAEEVGLVGSAHDAAARDLDAVRAVVNVDGVGAARTLSCVTHGFEALAGTVEAVSDRLDHPVTVDPTIEAHSDHWRYVEHGVPGCLVGSDTGDRGRGWGHTAADTLDKLEPRTFREQSVVLTAFCVALADDGFSAARAAREDVAAACEAQGLAEGMRATGDWPY